MVGGGTTTTGSTCTTTKHHYAFDAVVLLDDCIGRLQQTIDHDLRGRHDALYDMKKVFVKTERMIHQYLINVLEWERQDLVKSLPGVVPPDTSTSPTNDEDDDVNNTNDTATIGGVVKALKNVLEEKERIEKLKLQNKNNENNDKNPTKQSSSIMINRNNPQEPLLPSPNQQSSYSYCANRSATDTLLFRLIVILQLCTVRIDDAFLVVTGRRMDTTTLTTATDCHRPHHIQREKQNQSKRNLANQWLLISGGCMIGAAMMVRSVPRTYRISMQDYFFTKLPSSSIIVNQNRLMLGVAKIGVSWLATKWVTSAWNILWMTDKIRRSTIEIREWIQQWIMVQTTTETVRKNTSSSSSPSSWKSSVAHPPPQGRRRDENKNVSKDDGMSSEIIMDSKTRRLIEYAMANSPKSSFWQTQGEIRFLMLKRFMDVYYASVGTAIDTNQTSSWQLPLMTGAAASFYSLTGSTASRKATHTINTSSTDLIQHAWGMVSLPAIKNLMLKASRLLKGASVADRVVICSNGNPNDDNTTTGTTTTIPVPCFVLSREPAPELAAAIKRQHRHDYHHTHRQKRSSLVSMLSTIAESEEHHHHRHPSSSSSTSCNPHRFTSSYDHEGEEEIENEEVKEARDSSSRHRQEEQQHQQQQIPKRFAGSNGRYRQRDVIFHLTGGGFFAHTIASDLPYLLDWSARTGAVVICPEYALLPEYTFPVALNQIVDVYSSLVNGNLVSELGFEVNRIVITGESAGGNLAAALCVKLASQHISEEKSKTQSSTEPTKMASEGGGLEDNDSTKDESTNNKMTTDALKSSKNTTTTARMPDAIMLSCAALNLSLELSHSRVVGTQDPVLPSGMISAISDAYLPETETEAGGDRRGCFNNKKDPLVSPLFASDEVLRQFPPALLFAGSNDPLLDDSVTFNERLRSLGINSELRAARNVPHAYWGLGTAGFPEARQVQQECEEWLAHQLQQQ